MGGCHRIASCDGILLPFAVSSEKTDAAAGQQGTKIYLISSHPIEMEKRMVSLPLEQFFSCRQFSLSDGEDCVFCDCLSLSSPEVNLRSGFSAEYLIFPLVVFILNDGLRRTDHYHYQHRIGRRHFHHTLVDFHPPVQYQARSAR